MNSQNLGYKKSKQLAKDTYSKIGSISCPALDGEVIAFTNDGFNHLIRKGHMIRTKSEQRRRFALIPCIIDIIKNPQAKITFRQTQKKYKIKRHGKDIQVISVAKFWTFHAQINNSEVRVVIRQIQSGQKQFQSVM